jgi:hypothetical protein
MKKQTRKLKLAKETVRVLQAGALGQVAGASHDLDTCICNEDPTTGANTGSFLPC